MLAGIVAVQMQVMQGKLLKLTSNGHSLLDLLEIGDILPARHVVLRSNGSRLVVLTELAVDFKLSRAVPVPVLAKLSRRLSMGQSVSQERKEQARASTNQADSCMGSTRMSDG